MKYRHKFAVKTVLAAVLIPPISAKAQTEMNVIDQHQSSVAAMLHSRTDFAWLFDPVLLENTEITESERRDARQVIGLANVARAKGMADRADVRAARAAADDLILAEAARRSLVDSVRPTDAEVAQRIAAHPERYDEYRLRHIFVAVGPTRDGKSRSEADALALARRIHARIKGGERFETVAEAASEDASTAIEGGALSELLGATMSDAFFPYVQALPVGGITEPVRGPEGFHILKLEARQPASPASARYWVEQDILKERLPGLIAQAIAADRKAISSVHDRGAGEGSANVR
ncbi:peptidylprolyl isomerase [Sphingomonas sp. Leaf257]|uniref:peptidylprolyl isomerase n=1 Tax=Sphingomonas sp. Leaf257 TaxID=1736309 RepID=UPI0009E9F6DE|nr:peptidylprolyl isomerase [Sphingomonas sp. Leaf257]